VQLILVVSEFYFEITLVLRTVVFAVIVMDGLSRSIVPFRSKIFASLVFMYQLLAVSALNSSKTLIGI
jgi:hypothetical protein